MPTNLFCVYDSAAARYLDPFVAPTQEVAMRGFRQAVNTDGHVFNEYPGDYTLFHVGSFNAENGLLHCNQAPHSLGNGLEFMTPTQTPELNVG